MLLGMAPQCLIFLSALVVLQFSVAEGLLYPRESPSREVKELNGLWHFRADYSPSRNAGFEEKWYSQPLQKSGDTILMPVPSSYNDITQNSSLRDYVGWAWYDKQVWVPSSWLEDKTSDAAKRIVLRFESAHYNALAWVNGELVANHSGGHLPFEGEVTTLVKADSPNTITVAVNNTLTPHTLPPGTTSVYEGYIVQHLQMDFFNYAGLQRPVKLYTTPKSIHIDDVTVTTEILSNGSAKLNYTILVSGDLDFNLTYTVTVMDQKSDEIVASNRHTTSTYTQTRKHDPRSPATSTDGYVIVTTPTLWWPWTMSNGTTRAHMYTFQVSVTTLSQVTDTYRQPIGIRTVKVTDTQFLINGKPFYFQGFGKHEDANIRGKGLDYPLMMKDINLLLWLGANSFRTSHYPYAEELMDLCDKHGIVVVDETPAVGLVHTENYADETLQHHLRVITELVARDKNRPSVVMWSLANEPASDLKVAEPYFKTLAEHTRNLDPTRPLTFACNKPQSSDLAGQFMDIIAFNRYYGWYYNPGLLGTITGDMETEIEARYAAHHKPVMITEYGAGAIDGIHRDPPVMYSEEYQAQVFAASFPAFDKYRSKYFVGEMVWNFADFETAQSTGRADGNKKGVLTRERQPKLGAWVVRNRYLSLAKGGEHTCQSQSTFTCNNF